MKKADRQLNKLIRKIVAITDGMDKCKALKWLQELMNSIVFQIGVVEDDIRSKEVSEHAKTATAKLQEFNERHSEPPQKGKKKTKKAA